MRSQGELHQEAGGAGERCFCGPKERVTPHPSPLSAASEWLAKGHSANPFLQL
jgi:hypothetical protein